MLLHAGTIKRTATKTSLVECLPFVGIKGEATIPAAGMTAEIVVPNKRCPYKPWQAKAARGDKAMTLRGELEQRVVVAQNRVADAKVKSARHQFYAVIATLLAAAAIISAALISN